MIGLKFNGYMPVAKVVRSTCEVKGAAMFCAGRNAQQSLRSGLDTHQAAIVGHQHIAAAHHMTTLQKHRQHATRRVFNLEATFLSNIPIQRHGRCAFDQRLRQSFATRN